LVVRLIKMEAVVIAGGPTLSQPDSSSVMRNAALLLVFLISCAVQGPSLLRSLAPRPKEIHDFYQEWSSARNWARDRPVYTPVSETIGEYLRLRLKPGTTPVWNVNVHPPTAVLLAIPLQGLDYRTAMTVWNALSLAAILVSIVVTARAGGLHWSTTGWIGLAAGLMWFDPLHQQFLQGQLTAVLLLLMTLGWVAGRSGHDGWAGVCFGLAAAIKLFPSFLVLWLIGRRKWSGVATWAATVVVATGVTAAVLGLQTYVDYIQNVLPEAARWRGATSNASLPGLWCKLFAPTGYHGPSVPLVDSPIIAILGTVLSAIVVSALVLERTWRAHGPIAIDQAWCLTLCGTLLVSPVSWDHYFLLLLPAFLLLRREVSAVWESVVYWGGLVAFGLPMLTLAANFYATHAPTGPLDTLLFCELQCYALVIWFAWLASRSGNQSSESPPDVAVA
jgi:hypothetical protein